MIELLIGLVVATVVIVGIYGGNLYACVFTTLVASLVGAIATVMIVGTGPDDFATKEIGVITMLVTGALLTAVWMRRNYLLRQIYGSGPS